MPHFTHELSTLPRVLCPGPRGTAVLVPAATEAATRLAQCLFYASLDLAVVLYRLTDDDEVVPVPPTQVGRATPPGRRARRGAVVEEA